MLEEVEHLKTNKMVKKIVIISLFAFAIFYFAVFVNAQEVVKPSEISISLIGKNKINIGLTDSYYYIHSLKLEYSEKKDTLFLFVKKSTLANVFYKNKLGYKIIKIDTGLKVISYCGTSKLLQNLSIDQQQSIDHVDEVK